MKQQLNKSPRRILIVSMFLSVWAVSLSASIAQEPVLTGIDVLQEDKFQLLKDQRVGLITNHTGIDRHWNSTVKLFNDAPNVNLVALFSPEHGFEGKLDIAKINDSRDSETGLKIHSLYGKTRTPTDEMLDGIDTLVFDIQDIGTRFYTYISTMGNAMTAAAKHDIRFVVLDRPNPINGVDMQGPILDSGSESFVGFHPIPVRHGMTTGELAAMFNAELKLNLELNIVKVKRWKRSDYFDATGLPWINPSPNMRSLTQAVLYPGIGLLETTNLSVGRGTDTPFELIGAPYIDGVDLAAVMNEKQIPGIRFVPIRFTPDASKFSGEQCGGVNFVVVDRSKFAPILVGIELARSLRKQHPDDWEIKSFNRLLGSKQTFDGVLSLESFEKIQSGWSGELENFRARRKSFLLY